MFGFQEMLFVAAIVLGIIFVPALLNKRRPQPRAVRPRTVLSGKMRMALSLSVLYPAIAAAFLQPWRKDPVLFYYIGIGPVALGWVLRWVLAGFRRR